MSAVDLSVQLGRLRLKNPIATASGTFGYGLEFAGFVDLGALGAISVKGLSARPCLGNPPPRICETDAGMLNAIGLQNVGIEEFLSEKLPKLHDLGVTVLANVWGDTEAEYRAVVERIGDDPRIAAVELNVSCPNVVKGGMVFGNDPAALHALVAAVRPATRLPLVVKLSPNVTDIVTAAKAAVDGGADVLSLVNTLVGLSIDVETREPKIGFTTGGLSGPAIRPVALRMVWEVRQGAAERPDLRDRRHRDGRARPRVPDRRGERRPGRHGQLPRPGRLRPSHPRPRALVRTTRRGARCRAERNAEDPATPGESLCLKAGSGSP